MKLSIILRTDTNWRDMTREKYRAQVQNINLPTILIKQVDTERLIDAWEQAYGLNYYRYRAAIKEACYSTLVNTGLPIRFLPPRPETFPESPTDETEEILIPIDDDDTLSTGIGDIVSHFADPSIKIVCWERSVNYLGRLVVNNPTCFLDTCDWAIRRSFLDTFSPDERSLILAKHQYANKLIGLRLGVIKKPSPVLSDMLNHVTGKSSQFSFEPLRHPSVKPIAGQYSCYYLHSGSISFMTHKRDKRALDLVSYFRSLPLHPLFNLVYYGDQ